MASSVSTLDGENTTVEETTEESFLQKIQAKFGDEVMEAFKKEDIIDEASVKDLSQREADAPIFSKLHLSYGKAVAFKKEFGMNASKSRPCSPPSAVKPTMADIATFTPELRRLYLSKRKMIGTKATEKWGTKFPKFNTPQAKLELSEFSAWLEPVCGIPDVGFNAEGIAKHIQNFCNEQRRYQKLKTSNSKDPVTKVTAEEEHVKIKKKKKRNLKELHTHKDLSETDESDGEKCDNKSVSSNKSGEQDDISTGHDTEILNDSSDEHETPKALVDKKACTLDSWPLKTNQVIVKAVFGRLISRDDAAGVLKKKFSVQQKNLTALSPIQVLGVLAKKLVNSGYCTISNMENINSLKMSDLSVSKEIEL